MQTGVMIGHACVLHRTDCVVADGQPRPPECDSAGRVMVRSRRAQPPPHCEIERRRGQRKARTKAEKERAKHEMRIEK